LRITPHPKSLSFEERDFLTPFSFEEKGWG